MVCCGYLSPVPVPWLSLSHVMPPLTFMSAHQPNHHEVLKIHSTAALPTAHHTNHMTTLQAFPGTSLDPYTTALPLKFHSLLPAGC